MESGLSHASNHHMSIISHNSRSNGHGHGHGRPSASRGSTSRQSASAASMSQIRDLLMETNNNKHHDDNGGNGNGNDIGKRNRRLLHQACRESNDDLFVRLQRKQQHRFPQYYADLSSLLAGGGMGKVASGASTSTSAAGPSMRMSTMNAGGGPSSRLPSDVAFMDLPSRAKQNTSSGTRLQEGGNINTNTNRSILNALANAKDRSGAVVALPREVLFAPSPPSPRRRRSGSPAAAGSEEYPQHQNQLPTSQQHHQRPTRAQIQDLINMSRRSSGSGGGTGSGSGGGKQPGSSR
jgi:hypothetical protein